MLNDLDKIEINTQGLTVLNREALSEKTVSEVTLIELRVTSPVGESTLDKFSGEVHTVFPTGTNVTDLLDSVSEAAAIEIKAALAEQDRTPAARKKAEKRKENGNKFFSTDVDLETFAKIEDLKKKSGLTKKAVFLLGIALAERAIEAALKRDEAAK